MADPFKWMVPFNRQLNGAKAWEKIEKTKAVHLWHLAFPSTLHVVCFPWCERWRDLIHTLHAGNLKLFAIENMRRSQATWFNMVTLHQRSLGFTGPSNVFVWPVLDTQLSCTFCGLSKRALEISSSDCLKTVFSCGGPVRRVSYVFISRVYVHITYHCTLYIHPMSSILGSLKRFCCPKKHPKMNFKKSISRQSESGQCHRHGLQCMTCRRSHNLRPSAMRMDRKKRGLPWLHHVAGLWAVVIGDGSEIISACCANPEWIALRLTEEHLDGDNLNTKGPGHFDPWPQLPLCRSRNSTAKMCSS